MKKIFFHLGKREPDYRTLMRLQEDFWLDGHLIPVSRIVVADQTHSNLVHICSESDCGAGFGDKPQIPVVDGLATNVVNQFLLIRTADCTPIILMDHTKMAVAALHSGREGTRKNIAAAGVETLVQNYGSDPKNICAFIGAGICHQHYQVSEKIYDEYNDTLISSCLHPSLEIPNHINIRKGIFEELLQAGLTFKNIENIQDCTFEDHNYHSYRREGTKNRQINLVGIIDE
jgi:YfiH family protein